LLRKGILMFRLAHPLNHSVYRGLGSNSSVMTCMLPAIPLTTRWFGLVLRKGGSTPVDS